MRFSRYFVPVLILSLAACAGAQSVRTRFLKKVNLSGNTYGWYAQPLSGGGYAVLGTVYRQGRVDGVLTAYAPNGATLWSKTLWATYEFAPNALFKTTAGDLVVVARARDQVNDYSYLARVSPNGATQWARAWQFGVGGGAYAGAIDPNDNIYITGSGKTDGFENAYVAKVSPGGSQLWARSFPGALPDFFQGDAISVNASGEVIVDLDSAQGRLWRLDTAGNTRWTKPYINHIGPSDFRLDSTGNLYIAGANKNAIDDSCPAVQKIDATGRLLWTRLFNFDGTEIDGMTDLAFDTTGNVLAAGRVRYFSNNQDYFLTRISPAGAVSYTRLFNSLNSPNDTLQHVHVDARNQMYLIGSRQGTPDGSWTVRVDAAGSQVWNMITPLTGTAITYQTSTFDPATGDLLVVSHDAITASMVLYSYSQAAQPVANAYTVPKNSTYNSPNSVKANDFYAADATVVQVNAPGHGTLTLDADGTFVYKPATNYTGPDSFTYRLTKTGLSASAPVTVTLTVQ